LSLANLVPRSTGLLFFSNRLGCGKSLLITAIGTLLLLYLFGFLRV
jgi:hypothetical protein